MKILHPIDILKASRTEIANERTIIQDEAGRIQERLLDISSIITEYDVAISREECGVSPSDTLDSIEPCKSYTFTESQLKPITPAECIRECGDLTYCKKGDQITIRSSSGKHQVTSSWDYICEYYRNLPDKTEYNQIDLSVDKKSILVSFYSRHPNFNCSIVQVGPSKMIVKEPVHVGINTHSEGKVEADESAY